MAACTKLGMFFLENDPGSRTGEGAYKEVTEVNQVRGNLTGKEEPPELLVLYHVRAQCP